MPQKLFLPYDRQFLQKQLRLKCPSDIKMSGKTTALMIMTVSLSTDRQVDKWLKGGQKEVMYMKQTCKRWLADHWWTDPIQYVVNC